MEGFWFDVVQAFSLETKGFYFRVAIRDYRILDSKKRKKKKNQLWDPVINFLFLLPGRIVCQLPNGKDAYLACEVLQGRFHKCLEMF